MTLILSTLSRLAFLFSFILLGFFLTKIKVVPESADGVLYYRDGEPVVEGLADKTFTIDLKPGEGVFIVPLYKK